MQLGVIMFATDLTMSIPDLAREAEARGLSSVFAPEHTHIPVSRRTPPPDGEAELPDFYRRTLDPLVALGAAAAVTSRIRLGTGVILPAQRDPIVTAKAIATLDLIANGRTVVGVGFGWNADELEHHGFTLAERRAVVRERVLAMRALWRDDVAEFHGEYVDFAPSWSWPKPVQRPAPPILMGGAAGPKLFAAIAEYGDGWMPIGGGGVRAALPDLHRAAEAAGRDPATLRVVPFGIIADPGKIDYYAGLGIDEVILRLPSGPAEKVLPLLDVYAGLVP